jgi:DNA-binding NarL/FixJ family response regulator
MSRSERADAVSIDLRMPGMDGAEAIRHTREELPDTQVLVPTPYADDESLFPALAGGGSWIPDKGCECQEIEHAIFPLHAGRTHLDPTIQERLLTVPLDSRPVTPAAGGGAHDLPDALTPREARDI